ncbi:MAG: sulfurtransferase TusA family protein [Dehalococcoidia bacterium]|nr:hypothetical protein [Chloroflexota bacterium]MBT9163038.1 hypothetical protein [Chloroflexota bacterium]MBT9163987.1 hypothetical protein [Chloroflexota bacterium]
MIEIDARGLSCPVPVVKTQKALDQNPGERLAVLVESEVSRENVSRLARSRGYSVKVEPVPDGYRLELTPARS